MALSSAQLVKNAPTSAQLPLIFAPRAVLSPCSNCNHDNLARAKYCAECGNAIVAKPTPPEQEHRAPSFAEVHTHQADQAPKELRDELDKLFAVLTRERVFLCFHYLVFLTMSLFGFSLSVKTYNEFIGDEITKLIIALAPLFAINLLAFLCFSPIKGTKKEIARLKERITYVRYKIEYWA